MKMQTEKQIIEFLKPTWKKQILFLFLYFWLTGFISRLISIEKLKENVSFIGLLLILFYLLSCFVINRVLKNESKIKLWEITMFLGIVVGISFVYPFDIIWTYLIGCSEITTFISGLSVIIISNQYPLSSNMWLYMISPVILFATLGLIIGWFISLIFILGKELINFFRKLF